MVTIDFKVIIVEVGVIIIEVEANFILVALFTDAAKASKPSIIEIGLFCFCFFFSIFSYLSCEGSEINNGMISIL